MKQVGILFAMAAGVVGLKFIQYGRYTIGGVLLGSCCVVFSAATAQRWRSRPLGPSPSSTVFSASPDPTANAQAIPYRKRVIAPPLVLMILTIVGVSWIVWLAVTDPAHAWLEEIAAVVFAGLALFVVRGAIPLGRALFSSRPGLIVDDDGLLDATQLGKSGYRRIAWNEIARARWVGPKRRLAIDLADPREYLDRQRGLERISTLLALKTDPVPVAINCTVLRASRGDVADAIERHSRGKVRVEPPPEGY